MAMPKIITSIINALISNIPKLAASGVELLGSLVKSLPTIISTIVRAIPQIITAIAKAFKNGVSSIASAGRNLIEGLWNGISDAKSWLISKVKSVASSCLNAIKDFFGIHSPSTVFRDIIGKNLMLGLAQGISDEAAAAIGATQDVADEIADIEFEPKPPNPPKPFGPGDVDFDGLVANAQGTITARVSSTGTKVSAGSASTNSEHVSSSNNETTEGSDTNKPKYIVNEIYVDGKRTARVLTPYVEKELAWEGK